MAKARSLLPVGPAERKKLEAAMRVIERSGECLPRLPELAKAAGMSRFHFHRRFKACFGETMKRVITRRQVEEAKRLMLTGDTLVNVARKSGFASQSHFSNRFRQLIGTTPSHWLRAQV